MRAMVVRAVVFSVVGLVFAGLVLLPFHVRGGGIEVKCGAPAIAVSVPDVPEQCRRPADLRLGAAAAVLALVVAALGRRSLRSRPR